MTVQVYQDQQGKEPFTEWINSVKDRRTRARIDSRLDRLQDGNFGDWKSLGGGLFEMRLQFGSGYRVYYGREGENIIILLTGGDKGSQTRDIQKARQHWQDYQRRKQNE
ncbi:type II toxin-antitoxin system RelE/ParE family toxin [Candidatus Poribacteria bacterium]|nr:type II toxin-antitoxin system RelE/ParE family toxin [Candidatus Poribacteria bacterium]